MNNSVITKYYIVQYIPVNNVCIIMHFFKKSLTH